MLLSQTDRGFYKCWCCELHYYQHEGLYMKYEGGDREIWMCTRCGLQQEIGYWGENLATQGTLKKLKEKI